MRYNPNGTLDASFSGDGIVTTAVGTLGSEASAVAVQPDGKTVVAGSSTNSGTVFYTIIRYNADGSLDATFDGDGRVRTTFSENYQTEAIRALTVQSDGRIVAVGYGGEGAARGFAVARYNADGSLDTTFDGDGKTVTQITGNGNESANAVAVQTDGKIVAAGNRLVNESLTVGTIVRYTPEGRIDSSFASSTSGAGIITVSIPGAVAQELNAVVVQPDGKILGVGTYEDQTDVGLFVVQYNADGSRNSSFGGNNNGFALITAINGGGLGQDIALQPDGKIVVAGASPNFVTQTIEFAAYRFNADGTRDASFGTNGAAKIAVSATADIAFSVVVQPDGKIVLGGTTNYAENADSNVVLARFNANGTLDGGFGANGKVVTSLGSFAEIAADIRLQPDGKIVAVGIRCADGSCSSGAGFILRYNADGSLDNSFDGDGLALLQIPNSVASALSSVAVQPNGNIVAVGTNVNPATQSDALVARFNGDGSLDTSFGNQGFADGDIGGTRQEAFSVALDSSGKIVVGGYTSNGTRDDLAVWRYLGDAPAVARKTRFDFDGDGRADVSVFRPENGAWYVRQSSAGFTAAQFGAATDKIAPADYDGDGKTDYAVYRDGAWFLLRSNLGFTAVSFGQSGDVPQPADYDGDGRAEIAVFRPSNGVWYSLNLTNNHFTAVSFGISIDKPVVGDYDGDGKADYAVFRPENGAWYVLQSNAGFTAAQFGASSDRPVPADYDGDGKTDFAVYRGGVWFLLQSARGFAAVQFGVASDQPAAADYDGDGQADIAVYRNGNWFLQQSANGFQSVSFGLSNDKPTPNAFVP